MRAGAARHGPARVVRQDQLLAGRAHVPGQQQVVAAAQHDRATRHQQPVHLRDRARRVEPVPAVRRRDDVPHPARQPGVLGGRDPVGHLDPGGGVQLTGLGEQFRRDVHPGHHAARGRQLPRERARAGAQVRDPLTRHSDPERGEAGEELRWEPRAVLGVVGGRAAEVDAHAVSSLLSLPNRTRTDANRDLEHRQQGGDSATDPNGRWSEPHGGVASLRWGARRSC